MANTETATQGATEDDLLAARQALVEQTAAVDRQLAGKAADRTEAFVDAMAAAINLDALPALKASAEGLTGSSAQYAANLLSAVTNAPTLLSREIERLRAASKEPVAVSTDTFEVPPPPPGV